MSVFQAMASAAGWLLLPVQRCRDAVHTVGWPLRRHTLPLLPGAPARFAVKAASQFEPAVWLLVHKLRQGRPHCQLYGIVWVTEALQLAHCGC